MIYKIFFALLLVCSIPAIGQNIPEVQIEEIDGDSDEVPFAVIEKVPVYKGCDESLINIELKKCMSESISKHILENFNINVARGLGLDEGKVRIIAMFKVNKDGDVTEIKVRGPHPNLEKEAYQAISSIPKFTKPGYQRGKPVIVPYALPIAFNVNNSKGSKRKRKE
ncbi:MAG: energy transducer TonB [Aquaticitalea sp.]